MGNSAFFVLGLITIFALSFVHPVTSYVLLAFLPFLYIFEHVIKRSSNRVIFLRREVGSKPTALLILSFFVVGVLWIMFFGYSVFAGYINTIQQIILGTHAGEFIPRVSISSVTSTFLEKVLTISSFLLVGLLGLYGCLKYVIRGNWRGDLTAIATYFGFITLVSFSIMNSSADASAFAVRTPLYLFIGLSPLFGYATFDILKRVRGKHRRIALTISKSLIILLLVCFSISVVDQMPRNYYFFRNEEVTGQLWEARNASESLYACLHWYSSYSLNSALGISDVPIHDVGAGMYNLTITYYDGLYMNPSEIDQNIAHLKEMGASYVFIDKLMASYTEQWTYLVYAKPIPVSNLEFLSNNVTVFNMVYDNGIIQILYLHN
jgi:uncharacterized integral membrane protein